MKRVATTILCFLTLVAPGFSQTLNLPPRPADAPGGLAFARSLLELPRDEREEKIIAEIARGNVPDFLRTLCPVRTSMAESNNCHSAVYYVTPDYLAVGSDADYFLTPLTPISAQRVADMLHCSLPTRKMVDQIYSAAKLKLEPAPIPPSPSMTNVQVFILHNVMVSAQRAEKAYAVPLGTLTAGHKKDVVLSAKLPPQGGKVAIYGWHKLNGQAIQPLYTKHSETWADYSHGIRLVAMEMTRDGIPAKVSEVLSSPKLAALLSDEGQLEKTSYATHFLNASTAKFAPVSDAKKPTTTNVTIIATNASAVVPSNTVVASPDARLMPGNQASPFGEETITYRWEPDVLVSINLPTNSSAPGKMDLIFYTLPNGNTIEQTVGHQLHTNEDWHFDIQHIGAQTRFLRGLLKDRTIVVVYLQAAQKSWPQWRKLHADQPELIPQLVESIKSRFKNHDLNVILSGHSGGGSAIFGYLNGVTNIPSDVKRIAFLDSNYAYDEGAGHCRKLVDWLGEAEDHFLSVLAYEDYVALLNGKTFVSTNGGTWGRSHAMITDMGKELIFTNATDEPMQTYTAMRGRVKFLLLENPEKKILHTVQVERNGFIQSMLSGTKLEGKGYQYMGPRAYTNFIAEQ